MYVVGMAKIARKRIFHLADGCSLKETALRVEQAGCRRRLADNPRKRTHRILS
jgi:hypothetical protein